MYCTGRGTGTVLKCAVLYCTEPQILCCMSYVATVPPYRRTADPIRLRPINRLCLERDKRARPGLGRAGKVSSRVDRLRLLKINLTCSWKQRPYYGERTVTEFRNIRTEVQYSVLRTLL